MSNWNIERDNIPYGVMTGEMFQLKSEMKSLNREISKAEFWHFIVKIFEDKDKE